MCRTTTRRVVRTAHPQVPGAPYFVPAASHPELAGHRSLFVDLLGHGLSDRPAAFGYTLEEHAAALATALDHAGVRAANVVAHSMGDGVAVVLAHHRPDLVGRLVLVEANLEPSPAPRVGGSGINAYTEEEFLAGGLAEALDRVGPLWAATMRQMLERRPIPRTFVQGERGLPVRDPDGLTAAGVRVVTVPNAGHDVLLDNPEEFARVAAAGLAGPRVPGSR
ncbi:alpha/beta fold hydrolase [Micromonospora sp. KC723]|uniref:alpha/beta fold hydrolase n=1 Tax=Micromonospora sp. KC723 TaxID=2530381 RepID=UPI0010521840|nr:alpha/beta fold hydrolase [Micromonospora sp. KC723]TDB78089.1 alpha/beta fold hydrolase [Micromonospora sp. KC723]